MKYAVVLFAVVVVSQAAPEGDKAVAIQYPQLSEIFETAQKNINELAANIKTQLNLPDQEKVVEAIKASSADFANQVQKLAKSVTDQVKEKQPEIEKVLADIKTRLSKVAEDINANIPNAKESAEQLQKKFQEGVETIIKESNTIAETFKANSGQVKEEIAGFTKKAVDLAVEATQSLNEQLKNVATKTKKD